MQPVEQGFPTLTHRETQGQVLSSIRGVAWRMHPKRGRGLWGCISLQSELPKTVQNSGYNSGIGNVTEWPKVLPC